MEQDEYRGNIVGIGVTWETVVTKCTMITYPKSLYSKEKQRNFENNGILHPEISLM